jgi:ABC-2 type transport system ATP-binding protein
MPNVISVRQLKKEYSGKVPFLAVDEISFDLQEGEILGLLGPNGSGKTTTIQMLLGTLTHTSGSIFYFGKDFSLHRSDVLQHVAFASTYMNLPGILTIEENLEVFGRLYGLSPKESVKKYTPLLERFGILEKKKSPVRSLSAGQITRLVLVKAFFIDPKIVLLDEPTASLDPDIANDICAFLQEQREERGLSILFTSHKMDEVMEICDRAIFLKNGKIIADDIPTNLANSVSTFSVRLSIIDGLARTIDIIKEMGLECVVDHRSLEIDIDEEKIPDLLHRLSASKVVYVNIKIEEPSLEDFFLEIARR